MVTRSQTNSLKPRTFLSHILSEPTSFTQANKYPEWCLAMQEEYNALMANHTWSLVPSSPSQNVVGCKWVYRIKRNPDGSIARYKVTLVAKAFHQ